MATPTRKPPIYTVYVIELEPAVLTCRRFAAANAGYTYDPAHPPLYVGQSAHPPQKRFSQHCSGYRSGRYPRKYSVCLRMDLAGELVFSSRVEAEDMEAAQAVFLREQGFAVWQK